MRASLVYQTTPFPALDVLHHQCGEGRVWPLLHSFGDTVECMWLGNVLIACSVVTSVCR